MKCQMCGKSEVNFHYSSSINGCVTESHLCSECAQKSGYDFNQMFDFGGFESALSGFGSIFGGRDRFMPMIMPSLGFGIPASMVMRPQLSGYAKTDAQSESCSCCSGTAQTKQPEVDEDMKKRRELYEQMRKAANDEDFEKAAQLRDQIKEMEA